MKPVVSYALFLRKVACSMRLYASDEVLSSQDLLNLKSIGPELVRKVESNKKSKKDLTSGLSKDEKRILLAYVVFFRQNLAKDADQSPNMEDTINILHKNVLSEKKSLDKHLTEQLNKAGIGD